MGLRHRSIRLRVGILILVPVLCLIALYGFAASITLGNALRQARAAALQDQLVTPITAFQIQLDKEQQLAVLSLTSPSSTRMAYDLSGQEASTQVALRNLKAALQSSVVLADASAGERQLIGTLLGETQNLSFVRTDVDASALTVPQTLSDYAAMINDAYLVLRAAMDQQSNAPLATQSQNVIALDQAAQTTLEEADLLTGDINRKQFPDQDRIFFAQLAAVRDDKLANTLPQLDPPYRAMIEQAVPPTLGSSVTKVENSVIDTTWQSGQPPAQVAAGQGVLRSYATALNGAIRQASTDLAAQSRHNTDIIYWQLVLAAGLGMLGTIASIGLSLYIGRGLVRQLRSLRESALSLANDKLPAVIRRLRAGEAVDLSEYVVPATPGTRDEVEQVQNAFNIVQQSAIQSAVDEARLRRGISDVFRNLAGRSQSLLHRQLTLLDGMERRATEPDELEDLFRIDHLTTRMRRHAEGLIILSGEAPARGWRRPVPLIDVLRAAVAEVEDYTRIRVLSRTRAAVAGHAVADVIHLIAELAENATVFSPPNTPVRIQGDIVGRGFAIEIEDRGLGISSERLAEINANLADPPQFDLSDSDRLGLFIASQLARRHEISVTLQPSVYGGTIAVVLLPTALVVSEEEILAEPALPPRSQAGRLLGRHSALALPARGRLAVGNGATAAVDDSGPISLPVGSAGDDDDVPSGNLISGAALPPAPPASTLPRRRPAGEPAVLRLTPGGTASAQRADVDARITTSELTDNGLPTRVRQASLAPQLRDSTPAATVAPSAQDEAPVPSSPEAARSIMTALQRGWQLGRAEASAQLPDSAGDPRKSDYDVFAPAKSVGKPEDPATGDAEGTDKNVND